MVYNGCNYLSMLGIKLNHVSKSGHWATSMALVLSYDCNCDCEATLKTVDKYVIWIHRNINYGATFIKSMLLPGYCVRINGGSYHENTEPYIFDAMKKMLCHAYGWRYLTDHIQIIRWVDIFSLRVSNHLTWKKGHGWISQWLCPSLYPCWECNILWNI